MLGPVRPTGEDGDDGDEMNDSMSFRNVSTLDRMIRLLVGLLMVWAGWSGAVDDRALELGLRWFSLVPLVTGAMGWCPVYTLLGVSTRRLAARHR